MKKIKTVIEKETIIKEVNGEKIVKTTYRLLTLGANVRSIVLTEREIKDLRNQLNDLNLKPAK